MNNQGNNKKNKNMNHMPHDAILKAIWESPDDGIICKDENGIISAWSLGSKNLYGYTAQEIIGKSVEILLPKERFGE